METAKRVATGVTGMSLFIQAFALPSELLAEEVSLVFRPRSSC